MLNKLLQKLFITNTLELITITIKNNINNITNLTTNIHRNTIECSLTKLLYNSYSQNEFGDTILNSNLRHLKENNK